MGDRPGERSPNGHRPCPRPAGTFQSRRSVTVCLGGWDMFGIRERYRALTHPSVSPVAVPLWAHPRICGVPVQPASTCRPMSAPTTEPLYATVESAGSPILPLSEPHPGDNKTWEPVTTTAGDSAYARWSPRCRGDCYRWESQWPCLVFLAAITRHVPAGPNSAKPRHARSHPDGLSWDLGTVLARQLFQLGAARLK
jgi:hypothetical protein